MTSCKTTPSKTVEDLIAAYNGESTASEKYAAFAEKARSEGFDTVSIVFSAISKAESIHAANHLEVLEKLGAKPEGPQIADFNVLTTAENLQDAINGETYEAETMYPEFIADAEKENNTDAIRSFTWALDTEKKHKVFYANILAALSNDVEKAVPAEWFVCPVCGNTFDTYVVIDPCDFCMTPKTEYLIFSLNQ